MLKLVIYLQAQVKVEPEADKPDKPVVATPSSKPVLVGGNGSGPTPIKTRMPKKFSGKKDSGDSDSVSSDIVVSPRSAALASSAPSSATKSSVESTKAQPVSSAKSTVKESEKQSPPVLRTSSQTSKEEPMRVTRGDSMKMKDPGAAKEERSEKCRMPTKCDAKDSGKAKADMEKPSEKTESEKEEKHKSSRRVSRVQSFGLIDWFID